MTVQNVGVTTRKRRKIQEVNSHAELQSPDKLSAGLTNQTLPKRKQEEGDLSDNTIFYFFVS